MKVDARGSSMRLSPLLMGAVVLATNSSADYVWSSPLVLCFLVWYWLVLDAIRSPATSSPSRVLVVDACFLAWALWWARREIYVHHGEPWTGASLSLVRLSILLFLGAWLSFADDMWRRHRLLMAMVLQAHLIAFILPHSGDALISTSILEEDQHLARLTLVVNPIVKTACLVAVPLLLEDGYWSARHEGHPRYRSPFAFRRLVLQCSLVMGVWWFLSPIVLLCFWLRTRRPSNPSSILPTSAPATPLDEDEEELATGLDP